MKNFITKYYKEILLFVFGVVLTYLLIEFLTPAPYKSELLKYKLNELDKKIEETEKKQKQLDDSISVYKENVRKIDETITDIRNKKTTINNYYETKEWEIKGYDYKQVDSAFQKRYKY